MQIKHGHTDGPDGRSHDKQSSARGGIRRRELWHERNPIAPTGTTKATPGAQGQSPQGEALKGEAGKGKTGPVPQAADRRRTNQINEIISGLTALPDLLIPPMLEEAIGYTGGARLLALWWEPCGDECVYSDGQVTVVGANWRVYQYYMNHPMVYAQLYPYQLGSSDAVATDALLLDHVSPRTVRAYAGSIVAVRRALMLQWGPRDSNRFYTGDLSIDDVNAMFSALFDGPSVEWDAPARATTAEEMAAVAQSYNTERQNLSAVIEWMNKYGEGLQ